MSQPATVDTGQLEARALKVGMAGNAFMAFAGVFAAYLSHSQAILLDGLFSLVGLFAAFLGYRVSRNARRQADKYRPYGYASDEAIFTTFRSLSLLGLVIFAVLNALIKIVEYINGKQPAALVFEPMVAYFSIVGLTCFLLWAFHRHSWKKTGEASDILKMESKAAAFDGKLTAAAGIGLLGIQLLKDGFLSPITPIGDSIIVLLLCTGAIIQYFKDFKSGLGELAGLTASPESIATTRRAIRDTARKANGELVDVSVSKLGRMFTVVVYFNPASPISARGVDDLTKQFLQDLQAKEQNTEVYVVVSEHGRVGEPKD